jgi:hypothetical protein
VSEETPKTQRFDELPPPILDEVIRQFRSARNDILRYGVWSIRNLTEEEFNRVDDQKIFGYFQQDLLETRFVNRGRRVDVVSVWHWFDDQMSGAVPLFVGDREIYLSIEDKDLEKVRKRIAEVAAFLPILRTHDFDTFKRMKYKMKRTVMRLTYDLHHLSKRLDKYRKGAGFTAPIRGEAPPPSDESLAVADLGAIQEDSDE